MTRLTAHADRRLIRPTDRSHRFVLVELTAPPAARRRERAPVNLAFVLDRLDQTRTTADEHHLAGRHERRELRGVIGVRHWLDGPASMPRRCVRRAASRARDDVRRTTGRTQSSRG